MMMKLERRIENAYDKATYLKCFMAKKQNKSKTPKELAEEAFYTHTKTREELIVENHRLRTELYMVKVEYQRIDNLYEKTKDRLAAVNEFLAKVMPK